MKGEIELFLADATIYLEFFGIIAIAWRWLLQAITAAKATQDGSPHGTADADFYRGKSTPAATSSPTSCRRSAAGRPPEPER